MILVSRAFFTRASVEGGEEFMVIPFMQRSMNRPQLIRSVATAILQCLLNEDRLSWHPENPVAEEEVDSMA